jgi:hypothetical protein
MERELSERDQVERVQAEKRIVPTENQSHQHAPVVQGI